MRAILGLSVAFLAACGSGPAAQADSFRFTMNDGAVVSGGLRAIEGDSYVVATEAGDQKIKADAVRGMERAAAGTGASSPTGLVPTAEFTILTGDTRLLVGRLVSFEDGVYQLRTRSGVETVGVAQVDRIEVAWILAPALSESAPKAATLGAGTLLLSGSNEMAEGLATPLVEAFVAEAGGKDPVWARGTRATLRSFTAAARDGGQFTAEVRLRTSAQAVDALIRSEAEVAMMSRRMTPEEALRVNAAGLGDPLSPAQEHVVAPGGVVVLVHPANPIKALTLVQLADIFSGKVRSWAELGGPSRRIQVYVPEAGSGMLDVFQSRVLGAVPLMSTARPIASSTEMAEIMAGDASAIGLAEFSHIGNAAALAVIDECGITHTPSVFGISTGEYPLSTKLYFYMPVEVNPAARDFVAFALSEAGQRRLNERGIASLMPAVGVKNAVATPSSTPANAAPAEAQLQADLVQLAQSATRLSVVFRFGVAAAALDPAGKGDLDRLAEFLKSSKGQRRLALVGFSDSVGSPEANVTLSEKRARLIAEQLKGKGVEADLVVGFGPALPVACGTSPDAASRNRRVEAWLY